MYALMSRYSILGFDLSVVASANERHVSNEPTHSEPPTGALAILLARQPQKDSGS